MKKCFNNVQIFKSSEDCNKFSKSVSYETLVIGAATTGRECGEAPEIEGVITRRTSVRRGYLPEQSTHANEESLFASVTCFMRLPHRIQRMLLVMTIPVFALIFTLATISESRAECATGIIACGDDCAADDGKSTCHWEIDSNGKMTVTGSGAMKDYKIVNNILQNRPWGGYSISTVDIKGINYVGTLAFWKKGVESVSFDDTVTSIGGAAFSGNKLTSVVLPDTIESIGSSAFSGNQLTSVILPDSLKILSADMLSGNLLSEVVIPDTVNNKTGIYTSLGQDAEMLENLRIECKGNKDSCQKLNKLLQKYAYKYEDGHYLFMDLSHQLFSVGQENCDSTNFYWNGDSCIREPDVTKRKCCSSCKDVGGWCNRIRYTPAEAAEVLRDDDTNEIVITFRK